MVDSTYEKQYMDRKKNIRKIHHRLKETKSNQETYHKLIGSRDDEDEFDSLDE